MDKYELLDLPYPTEGNNFDANPSPMGGRDEACVGVDVGRDVDRYFENDASLQVV